MLQRRLHGQRLVRGAPPKVDSPAAFGNRGHEVMVWVSADCPVPAVGRTIIRLQAVDCTGSGPLVEIVAFPQSSWIRYLGSLCPPFSSHFGGQSDVLAQDRVFSALVRRISCLPGPDPYAPDASVIVLRYRSRTSPPVAPPGARTRRFMSRFRSIRLSSLRSKL